MNLDRQTLLGGLLAVALVFAVAEWIVSPVLDYRRSLQDDIQSASQALGDVRMLGTQYARLSQQLKDVEAGGKAEQTLFALLENKAAQSGLRGRIDSMRPSVRQDLGGFRKDVVEMRLTSVPLGQFVNYLVTVENAGRGVRVERLNLRAHDKRPLDADLVFTVLGQEAAQ